MGSEVKNRNTKEVVSKDGEAVKNDKKKPSVDGKSTATDADVKASGSTVKAVNDWQLVYGTFEVYLYPMLAIMFLAIALRPYSVADYNDLLTDKYLLFGFDNLEKLRKHCVDNVIGSCIWAFTYLYVRRALNPEFRKKIPTFVQDGYYGALATFATGFLKAVLTNFIGK